MERLQKLISRAGVTSRRDAENLIAAGLNGVAEISADPPVEDKLMIFEAKKIYILLNMTMREV